MYFDIILRSFFMFRIYKCKVSLSKRKIDTDNYLAFLSEQTQLMGHWLDCESKVCSESIFKIKTL
jgi:hypothetical protein